MRVSHYFYSRCLINAPEKTTYVYRITRDGIRQRIRIKRGFSGGRNKIADSRNMYEREGIYG